MDHELPLALAVLLGGVFVKSSLPKIRDRRHFLLEVMEYRVLPPILSRAAARTLPPGELAAGLLVLSGEAVRVGAVLMGGMLCTFMAAVGVNIARGRQFDCGCFGKGGRRVIGWRVLLEDTALLAGAVVLGLVSSGWTGEEMWAPGRLISGGAQISRAIDLAVVSVTGVLLIALANLRRGLAARTAARSGVRRL